MTTVRRYDVPCTLGLESVLADELTALGARWVRARRGGVTCQGDLALGYRACLWLRSAVRVQELLAEFDVSSEQDLYERVTELPWENWLGVHDTLAVDATVRDSVLTHSGYVAVRVKDAIVDRFRDRTGSRPSVDRQYPRLPLRLRLVKGRASLARDLAGQSLHKRGYRPIQVKSPLNEATAAGLLLLAGYDGTGELLDPLCGSGTFLIEAAWIASDRAPGLDRRFCFTGWPDFERATWHELVGEALDRVRHDAPARLLGVDRHEGALSLARRAVRTAGVESMLQLVRSDIGRWRPEHAPRWIFTNPPWGERLSDEVEATWDALADLLAACPGATAHVLCGNGELTRHLRMKADRRWPVRNGPIDCRLLRYRVHRR